MADINISDLISYHNSHKKLATITAVLPPGRYGALNCENNLVKSFQEKPRGDGGRINGGFFVLSPKCIPLIKDDNTVWEDYPLKKLAESLVSIAKASNCNTKALITNMDDPLSSSIGNSLEVETVVEVLLGKNKNEYALLDTTIALSVELYSIVYSEKSPSEIKQKIYSLLESGHVAECFEKMVSALGGPKNFLSIYQKVLPRANSVVPVKAKKAGFISQINTKALGDVLVKIGGGRQKASDKLDLSVGFTEVVKSGQEVNKKTSLLFLHGAGELLTTSLEKEISDCFSISESGPAQLRTPILQKVV